MADELSIQHLAFNFGARTYAFSRLAQGLSRDPTNFCSFARQHLDPCIAKDICYQYMDDIGCGASSVKDLLEKLDQIFQCINKSGLKLSPAKGEFGVKSLQFLDNLIKANGLTPDTNKVTKFLNDLEMPKTTKQVKRITGFLQFLRAFIPKLQQHLLPFYKLLKNSQNFIITQEHHECLDILKKSLIDATKMSLRFPLKDKHIVIMTDASMHAAGYVLLIEDYTQKEGNEGEKRQYAPIMFGSHAFNEAQLKMSIYCKEFLAVYYAFENFCHLIWGCSKKVVVLTDNRSLVQFFQAKHIPRNLWLMVDRLMSYDFILGHIPGKANAADFLSRVPQKPNEAIELMIRNTIPIQQIEIEFKTNLPPETNDSAHFSKARILPNVQDTLNSQSVVSCLQKTTGNNSQIEHYQVVETNRVNLQISAIGTPDPLNNFDVLECIKHLNIAEEQKKDREIQQFRSWINNRKSLPRTNYLTVSQRKYIKQLDRFCFNNDIVYRKFFNHAGQVSHKQILIPKHLRRELLYRIHNSREASHRGITQTVYLFRKHSYLPEFQAFLIDYIKKCLTCLQIKPIQKPHLTPPLLPLTSLQNFPEELLQIDIVRALPVSGGFKYILTAIDVFSKYLFAVPLKNPDAKSVAQELVSIFHQHCYIPDTILSDLGSVFLSKLFKELTVIPQIQLNQATLKQPQTIGLLERSHAVLKKNLKVNINSPGVI